MLPYQYRFLDVYYVLNYIVLLSYFCIRRRFLTPDSPLISTEKSWIGLTREWEIFLVMCIIQLKNLRKKHEVDAVVQSLLLGLKVVVLSLVFQMNKTIFIIYVVIYVFIFVLVQPPKYRGPTNVLNYSEASFRSIVLSDPTNTVYYVMFDALWATGIEYVRYLFASLSLKYADTSTVFIHVDITRYPALAKELKINMDGYAGEIPVFIAYRKGKEISRIPEYSEKPRMRSNRWTEEILCSAFGLSCE